MIVLATESSSPSVLSSSSSSANSDSDFQKTAQNRNYKTVEVSNETNTLSTLTTGDTEDYATPDNKISYNELTDNLNSVCESRLASSLQYKRRIALLHSWSVEWGAYCRRTATKENQDGWFVLRSELNGDTEVTTNSQIHDIVNASPMSQSPIKPKVDQWGCWDEYASITSKPRRRSTGGINQVPSPNTMSDLSNRILAMNLDSMSSYNFLSSRTPCRSPDDSHGGSNSIPTPGSDLQSSLTCRRPWVFGVLDGHGSGGRIASHEASKTLTTFIQNKLQQSYLSHHSNCECDNGCSTNNCDMKEKLCQLRNALKDGFGVAQERLIASNLAASRDFGTTAVVSACLGRYILTATCGDSSAVLVVCNKHKPNTSKVIVNVQLSVDHTLLSATERSRISSEGTGRIVIGDGGVHRLIPGEYSYEDAKMKGLSINMARALGHFVLSKCSLSPLPQVTLVDLSDIYQTLTDLSQTAYTDDMRSYLFEAREFEDTVEHKFRRVESATTNGISDRETTTGTSAEEITESTIENGINNDINNDLNNDINNDINNDLNDINNVQLFDGKESRVEEEKNDVSMNALHSRSEIVSHSVVDTAETQEIKILTDIFHESHLLNEQEHSPMRSLSETETPVFGNNRKKTHSGRQDNGTKSASGGRKRRNPMKDLGNPNSPKIEEDTNWGVRGQPILDWSSPEERSLASEDYTLTQQSEAADCISKEEETMDDVKTDIRNERKEEVIERDEWDSKLQNDVLLNSVSQLIEEATALLILMSDGISDVLSRSQVGELALLLDRMGNSPQQISDLITFKAAQIRRHRGFRADNCTCEVVKLGVHQ